VFDWLFEGRLTVYALLAVAAIVLGILWWRERKPRYLFGIGVVLALMAVYSVLDWAVETDREQIVRKVREMSAAVHAGNIDALFKDISDQFKSPQGRDMQATRDFARGMIESKQVTEVTVWDFHFNGDIDRARPVEVVFQVKPRGSVGVGVEGLFFRCVATFVHEGNGGWRLHGCKLFPPGQADESNAIPAF
jgi:hypothetical protein